MKFDYCVGNPPYQSTPNGANDKFSPSVYNDFMDAAYSISDKAVLITPARFLFRAGNTPKSWNEKMLADEHFKVLRYEADSSAFFPKPISIRGGVAIHYRDSTSNFGKIGQFTSSDELNSIKTKVVVDDFKSLTSIMYLQNKYNLKVLLAEHPECQNEISCGTDKRLRSNAFDKVSVFTLQPSKNQIKILGLSNGKRTYRFIASKYIETNTVTNKYKVLMPVASSAGKFGSALSPFEIGDPLTGFTETFMAIGAFETQAEAQCLFKYLKTKFVRTLLGILKTSQNGKREVWEFVPIQNFTTNSDIDWSQSIADIDKQLYKKYGLSKAEIEFIETNVKAMA